MKKCLYLFAMVISCEFAFAQKASEVLENGIHLKPGDKIFLQVEKNVMEFDGAKSLQDTSNPPDFITLEDSTIFLVSKGAVNVYMRPLNPLNFSYLAQNKIVIDPVNEAASQALESVIGVLGIVAPRMSPPVDTARGGKRAADPVLCKQFTRLESKVKQIQDSLADDKKSQIVTLFEELKKIDFLDEKQTTENLITIKTEMTAINNHFEKVKALISAAEDSVKAYPCDYPEKFIARYVFNDILKDLARTREEQRKRYANLESAYKLVAETLESATKGGGRDGLRWCIPLDEVPAKDGKVSIYTVTIKESGYKISDTKEIVSVESKEVLKRTFRVRRFQRFVPEVSVGTAYTFFKHNVYGTTTDSTGQQYVAEPTENVVRNFNITTMVNFSYYVPHSSLHPFYQLGAGLNSGVPSILTGIGIRSNINGVRRIAISGGIGMSWLKELDELEVGSPISGTADIDNDLKYRFSWPPKLYIGIQYNF